MKRKNSQFFFLVLLVSVFFAAFLVANGQLERGILSRQDQIGHLACNSDNLLGEFDPSQALAIFEGKDIRVPLAVRDKKTQVLGLGNGEKWIEVDLSEQKLRAWEGSQLFLETSVSTGLPWWPTPTGEFKIWTKFRYTKMEGGEGKYYYNLPNVPYVMFFEGSGVSGYRGYGLHGTYWHSDFGTRRSHGCVNLPTPVAEKLYYWTTPALPEGEKSVRADNQNIGTKIVIHQ